MILHAANKSSKLSRVNANSKNSGHGPNQPLTVSDAHSEHLQSTKPPPYYIFVESLGVIF